MPLIAQSDATYFDYLRELTGADKLGVTAGVVTGDAIDTMRKLPRGCVDLLFADPPYFLSNGGTTVRGGRRAIVSKGAWDVSAGIERDHAFHLAWLEEAQRVLKPSGTIWVSGTHHSIFSVGWAMQCLGFHTLNTVAWCKPNAPPNIGCRAFTHSTELIIWAAPRERSPLQHVFNDDDMRAAVPDGKQMRDWWVMPIAPASERRAPKHPTQKPEALLDRIILASSRPGDLVLDPFLGSGTTGAMAAVLGRRFLGVELDPKYARSASKRIAAALR